MSLKDTVGEKNSYRYRGYRYNSEIGRFINEDAIGADFIMGNYRKYWLSIERIYLGGFRMNSDELLKKIQDIIFSVPGEIYKYNQPSDCFDDEWQEASAQEKAFLLVESLLINLNKSKVDENLKQVESLVEVKIAILPRFYSIADENMFFNAIYTAPSIKEVIGNGRELFLYYDNNITSEERNFIVGLFKRYQIPIPSEIKS